MKSIVIIGFDPERSTIENLNKYKKCEITNDYISSYITLDNYNDLSGLSFKKLSPRFSILNYEKDGVLSTLFVPSYHKWSDFDTEKYYIKKIKDIIGNDNNVLNFTTDFDFLSDVSLACLADPEITEGYPNVFLKGITFTKDEEIHRWSDVSIVSSRLLINGTGCCDTVKIEYGLGKVKELVLRYNQIEQQDVVLGRLFTAFFNRLPGTSDDAYIVREVLRCVSVYDSAIARSIITYCNDIVSRDTLPDKFKDLISI